MSDAVVALQSVTKSFKGNTILDDVNLTIERGRTVGIAGRNGVGKSVLLRLLCGFAAPDFGDVKIAPDFLTPGRSFPDYFGVMIDGPPFVAGLSALDNLRDLAAIRKRATLDELHKTLADVGLDPTSKKKARSFSTGMKQKLGLAQALIEAPRVLILDEPFNALDDRAVVSLKALLKSRIADGVTLVFTSHDLSDFVDLDADVHVIDGGKINRLRP